MRTQRFFASSLAPFAVALLASTLASTWDTGQAAAQAAPVYPPAAPVYPPAAPPPGEPVSPAAPPAPPGAPVATPRAAARPTAVQQREARAVRAEQRRARDRARVNAGAHRLSATLGFAPAIVARELPGGKARAHDWGAFRQRTLELGLTYSHDVSPWLGVRAGAAFGLGVTHLDLAADGGDCCRDDHARLDPSYSLSFDAAPVFQVARIGFYAAPGAVLRMFFLPDNARTLTAEADDLGVRSQASSITRLVSFKSPAVVLGFRPSFGFRFGPERRVDVNFGGDVGVGFRNADVYVAMFLRAGYAFVSLGKR